MSMTETEIKGFTEPRLYSKPLRELSEKTTLGFALIKFAKNVLKIQLYPWQEWLAIHALEIEGDINGEWNFRYRNVLVLVARQNGKTTFLQVLTLFFMVVLKVPLVLGTAQSLPISERIMFETLELAQACPKIAHTITKVSRSNGAKSFKTAHSEYVCRPSDEKAARGLSADLAIMDEIREHTDDGAWASISKTTIAKPNAQIWAITSAGDSKSLMLNRLRTNAHIAIGDPDGIAGAMDKSIPIESEYADNFGIFEWSAEPNCEMTDPRAWQQANPALGYGLLTERAIKSALATDGERAFRTEVLCQWVESRNPNPFGQDAWEQAKDENSQIVGKPYFGIDVSKNRDYTAISVCGKRSDGSLHTEVVEYRLGVGWALDWLRKRVTQYDGLTIGLQERGSVVSGYIDEFKAIDGLHVVPIAGKHLTDATGAWYDGVMAHTVDSGKQKVWHIGQDLLTQAVDGADRKMFNDGAFLFDRNKSVADISPIQSCIMAYGAFSLEKDLKNDIIHPSAINNRGGEVFLL